MIESRMTYKYDLCYDFFTEPETESEDLYKYEDILQYNIEKYLYMCGFEDYTLKTEYEGDGLLSISGKGVLQYPDWTGQTERIRQENRITDNFFNHIPVPTGIRLIRKELVGI